MKAYILAWYDYPQIFGLIIVDKLQDKTQTDTMSIRIL